MIVSLAISDLAVRGGTHKQLLRLGQYLRQCGDDVEILTYDYQAGKCYEEFQDFRVKTIEDPSRNGPISGRDRLRHAIELLRQINPNSDLLNIHDIGCEWLALACMLSKRKLPIVWQINDLHTSFRLGASKRLESKWTHPIHRFLARSLAQHARAVTVNVNKNAERVREHLGVDAHVLHCGVDRLCTELTPRMIHNPIRIVSIGVFFRHRNYESILEAMVLLQATGTDCNLTIIGSTKFDEAYAGQIARQASESNLRVEILGEVDQQTVVERLKESDVFVFVNVDQSWGLSVFEAMTVSLPAVLSKSVGAMELLATSAGVVVVDPQNPQEISAAIQKITGNQEAYNRMAVQAFHDASSFSWDAMYSSKMRTLFQML